MPAALVITYGVFVVQALDDPRSLLDGDARAVVVLAAQVLTPLLLVALVPVRWPALLGLASAALLVPRGWIELSNVLYEPWQLWVSVGATLVAGALLGRATAPWCALAWLAALWSPPPSSTLSAPSSTPRPDQPPLVLITLDTFRADHVSHIGESPYPHLTPHLDALARRGLLFTEGVAPAPVTGPSHAGLLTGRFPPDVGVRRNGDRLADGAPAVAAELEAAGWRTGAFVASGVLDRRVGLDRGFAHYDDRFAAGHRLRGLPPLELLQRYRWLPRHAQRSGDDVVARALRWVGDDPSGTFLWVHLYDAHSPYEPEIDPDTLYTHDPDRGGPDELQAWSQWRKTWYRFRGLPGVGRRNPAGREMKDYAAEIHEVDARVGRLLDALPPDTRVVVASDHGESLVEHGYVMNHGRHVFRATTRVPLWVVGADVPAGRRVDAPVPSWLVGDELRRLAGLPHDRSLSATVDTPWTEPIESYTSGQEARPAFLLGPSVDELSIRDGPDTTVTGPLGTLRFDVHTDPDQRWPEVLSDDLDQQDRLRVLMEGPELDAETESWLEALGYTE